MIVFLILIAFLLAVIFVPNYSANVSVYNDSLFFMREKQFKDKVLQSGHDSIWSLIDTLMNTTEEDWIRRGNHHMYYQPFPNTTIWFGNTLWLDLEIIEGTGKKRLFNLCYFNDSKQIGYGYDYITNRSLKNEDTLRMEQIMFHLNDLLKNLKNQEKQALHTEKQKEEEAFLQKKKMKKEQLLSLLEERLSNDESYQRHGFSVELKKGQIHTSLMVSFKESLYFQALQMNKTGHITTKIHNRENKDVEIFTELEANLQTFAKEVFDNTSSQTSVLPNEQFEEDYNEPLTKIDSMMAQLEQEETWLSVESFHQVKETFPRDLYALQEVYRVVRVKERVHEEVTQSLSTILHKLEGFVEEAETNKQKEVAKRKLIIEKR